jgi:signal transduction histidine kinase
LIDNAIDATGGEGEITIRTSMDDEQIVVEIGDNGSGISEEDQCRVFARVSARAPGWG